MGLLLNTFLFFTQKFCTSEKRGVRPFVWEQPPSHHSSDNVPDARRSRASSHFTHRQVEGACLCVHSRHAQMESMCPEPSLRARTDGERRPCATTLCVAGPPASVRPACPTRSPCRRALPSALAAAELELQQQTNTFLPERNARGLILTWRAWGGGQGERSRTGCCRGSRNSWEWGNC